MQGAKKEKHTWKFAAHFHAGRYGWKASALACKRVKEAVKEIQTVSRADSALAAEGAIKFMERVNPAFMHVDGSSGALGAAIARAVKLCRPYINLMFGEKTSLVLAV